MRVGAVSQPYLLHVEQVALDHDDFDAAAQSNTINVGAALPANAHILRASVECTEAPAGGGCVTYTVEFGDAADPNGLEAGSDHIAGGIAVYDTLGAYITTAGGYSNAARQLQATATVDGAHQTQDATAGEWTFRYAYIQFYD